MRYAQKDIDMGAYNISVHVGEHNYALVPENPHTIQVPLTTITFHCPHQNIPAIQNAPDNVIYRVEVRNPAQDAPDSLQVTNYPVVTVQSPCH
jgi:hypothetical protein